MKLSIAVVLICLLLCEVARSDCQQSRLFDLQTGVIALNPNDLGAAGATKDYYQPLTNASFGAGDRLGYAFALVGFQASCTQEYFSLMVSVVTFQNSNTKMSIVVDFRNPNKDSLTTWTSVQLSYLVVSAARYETTPVNQALIWATNVQVDLTGGSVTDQPILFDNLFNHAASATQCGLTLSGGIYQLDTDAGCTLQNLNVNVHAYIMGFQFKPISTSTDANFLAASVIFPDLDPTTNYLTVGRETPAAPEAITIVYDPVAGNVAGPQVTLNNYGGQLQTIKVAFVFTVINQFPAGAPETWDMGVSSLFQYSYSGIYQVVPAATYGIQSIIQTTNTDNNALLTELPTTKYMIFGLSSFEILRTSACTSVSLALSIDTPNSYTFTANNVNFLNNVIFQADIYTANNGDLCNSQIAFTSLTADAAGVASTELDNARGNTATTYDNLIYKTTRISQVMQTNPTNTINQYIYQSTDNPLDLSFFVNGLSDDSTYVKFHAEVVMQNITNGKPYGIRLQMIPITTGAFHDDADGNQYFFQLTVGGNILYSQSYNATQVTNIVGNVEQNFYGMNLNGTNVTVKYDLWIPRNPLAAIVNYQFEMIVDLYEFQLVYDPVTECCVQSCPANTGLNVNNAPATCVKCDTSKGLYYNPAASSCACITGYYLDANLQFQCFPCQGAFCATCDPTATTKCLTCITGALLNTLNSSCACTTGYFVNGSICSPCPAKCATCASSTTCTVCSDATRDPNNNCTCLRGFFDAGVAQCSPCNPSCYSCNNSQTCLQCDPRLRRVISGNICICADGYYEIIYQNSTKSCQACSGECLTCGQSSSDCKTCDVSKNRILGYDNLGHRTCLCQDGYHALADFSCVQSNCTADPFCSQCQKDLLLCVQCQAAKFRTIDLKSHVCVCQPGYYQDSNKVCQACGSGCATCSSATNCTSCVATATPINGTGTCACPSKTFFTTTTDKVGYCSSCPNFCSTCSSSVTCTTCSSGFNLTTDGTCVCPTRFFINTTGQCIPCKTGCAVCSSNTTCSQCVPPLVVQSNSCVGSCSSGFYLSGTVCQGCPANCDGCTTTNQCYYCKTGFYLFQGGCYTACPSGTVANNATFQCTPCNSPCRTCVNQPSICSSCEPGQGYLQITGSTQLCVQECAAGTYPNGNVCSVCDFRCAQCLGTSTNCIACPAGQFLYQAACWSYCPGVTVNSSCIDACPSGYYRFSNQQCKPCDISCSTCNNASSCLTCKNGTSLNGKCVTDCGTGYYSFMGYCVACDKSCKDCSVIPTQCTTCATGYIKSGINCVSGCSSTQFFDAPSQQCLSCNSTCKTCSAQNFCTSCPNPSIQPIQGQCLQCIYPCATCSSYSVCTSCLSGFSLSSGSCVQVCPSGSRAVNGVCTCASGIFLNGQCVSSCPNGFANINGTCQACQSPCTSCSGSVSSCTDCLDGYTLNPNTHVCTSSNQCQYGQIVSNGNCVRICDTISSYQNGVCIFGGCPNGFKDNGYGGCVASTTVTTVCSTSTFSLNGVCVSSCGNGFYPNSNSATCVACQTNCNSCLSASYCLACATGFTAIDGSCVAQSKCSATQFSYGSSCVATCPIGTFNANGICVRSCPPATYYYAKFCYGSCPTAAPLLTDNACVLTCPAGTSSISGVCA